MFRIEKIAVTLFLMPLLGACAVSEFEMPELPMSIEDILQPNQRDEYNGIDSVGAVEAGALIGTWQVEYINGTVFEKAIDLQFTFNEGNAFAAIAKAQIQEPAHKFEHRIKGVWSVEDEYVTVDQLMVEETTSGSSGETSDSVFEKEGMTLNVYELSADQVVVYNEEDGTALSLTRLD